MTAERERRGLDFSLDYTRKIHFRTSQEPQTSQELVVAPSVEIDGFAGVTLGEIVKVKIYKRTVAIKELPVPNEIVTAAFTIVASIFAVAMAVREYRRTGEIPTAA